MLRFVGVRNVLISIREGCRRLCTRRINDGPVRLVSSKNLKGCTRSLRLRLGRVRVEGVFAKSNDRATSHHNKGSQTTT